MSSYNCNDDQKLYFADKKSKNSKHFMYILSKKNKKIFGLLLSGKLSNVPVQKDIRVTNH